MAQTSSTSRSEIICLFEIIPIALVLVLEDVTMWYGFRSMPINVIDTNSGTISLQESTIIKSL